MSSDIGVNAHLITISLYANLKEKAGTGCIKIEIPVDLTVAGLKKRLKFDYPALGPQLANVVVLINKQNILLDNDIIPINAEITFLPPISGG